MDRKLYAACPRCGRRAEIRKFIWDWDEDVSFAQVRCVCGDSQIPYAERRVLKIDIKEAFLKEDHFDLLVPPGWEYDMLKHVKAGLPKY